MERLVNWLFYFGWVIVALVSLVCYLNPSQLIVWRMFQFSIAYGFYILIVMFIWWLESLIKIGE